jgi:hypothetical protein
LDESFQALEFSVDAIYIERCRLSHSYDLQKAFRNGLFKPHNLCFAFKLNIFQLECFEYKDGTEQYGEILKLLAIQN